ncbi:hypothetical protein ACMHYB_54995 [Sorangium sp. So ce1128]
MMRIGGNYIAPLAANRRKTRGGNRNEVRWSTSIDGGLAMTLAGRLAP